MAMAPNNGYSSASMLMSLLAGYHVTTNHLAQRPLLYNLGTDHTENIAETRPPITAQQQLHPHIPPLHTLSHDVTIYISDVWSFTSTLMMEKISETMILTEH
jgi:hypothetical protein